MVSNRVNLLLGNACIVDEDAEYDAWLAEYRANERKECKERLFSDAHRPFYEAVLSAAPGEFSDFNDFRRKGLSNLQRLNIEKQGLPWDFSDVWSMLVDLNAAGLVDMNSTDIIRGENYLVGVKTQFKRAPIA